jgi:microcompartment protein CcmL/EutN
MNRKAIGLIELSSVAAGFAVADEMLKAGDVQLILSRSICSGKFMVLIGGAVASVQRAIEAGTIEADGYLIDKFIISNVHADVFAALGRSQVPEQVSALGVVESFSVASLLEGADAAAKAANVKLLEIRLAMALGGKAYCTFAGDVAAVQSAVHAATQVIAERGLLVNAVVISRPDPDIWRELV